MNRFLTSLVFLVSLGASVALAEVSSSIKTVTVNGMVCAFCAQGIEKNLSAEEAVKKVDVSLEEHRVVVHLKDGKTLADARITEILKEAGYSVESIK